MMTQETLNYDSTKISRRDVTEIEDLISSFVTVASGTANVSTGQQYINSGPIPPPSVNYRNYILIIGNKSGQSITNVTIMGITTQDNYPVPNTPSGTTVNLKLPTPSAGTLQHGVTGCVDLTSEEPNPFCVGNGRVNFNLSAVAAGSGTIDWALIGY